MNRQTKDRGNNECKKITLSFYSDDSCTGVTICGLMSLFIGEPEIPPEPKSCQPNAYAAADGEETGKKLACCSGPLFSLSCRCSAAVFCTRVHSHSIRKSEKIGRVWHRWRSGLSEDACLFQLLEQLDGSALRRAVLEVEVCPEVSYVLVYSNDSLVATDSATYMRRRTFFHAVLFGSFVVWVLFG